MVELAGGGRQATAGGHSPCCLSICNEFVVDHQRPAMPGRRRSWEFRLLTICSASAKLNSCVCCKSSWISLKAANLCDLTVSFVVLCLHHFTRSTAFLIRIHLELEFHALCNLSNKRFCKQYCKYITKCCKLSFHLNYLIIILEMQEPKNIINGSLIK